MPRIVVVDDYDVICDNLRLMLEEEGFDVETFNDPLKALEYCKCHRCDMIISDVRMPGMDGLSLLEKIRKYQPGIRTMVISSRYDEDEDLARSLMKRHCDAAFPKPFSLSALLRTVMGLMAHGQLVSLDAASPA